MYAAAEGDEQRSRSITRPPARRGGGGGGGRPRLGSNLLELAPDRWQDGQRFERQLIDEFDRWDVHCADTVTVCADDVSIAITQEVNKLLSHTIGKTAMQCLHKGITTRFEKLITGAGCSRGA